MFGITSIMSCFDELRDVRRFGVCTAYQTFHCLGRTSECIKRKAQGENLLKKSDLPLCLVKECSYEGLCVGIFVYPYLKWFATGFGCCLKMSCGKDAPPMLVGSNVYRIQLVRIFLENRPFGE